jgi:hypothetical protein
MGGFGDGGERTAQSGERTRGIKSSLSQRHFSQKVHRGDQVKPDHVSGRSGIRAPPQQFRRNANYSGVTPTFEQFVPAVLPAVLPAGLIDKAMPDLVLQSN